MPNHITNKLTIRAASEKVDEILKFVHGSNYMDGEEQHMDFRRIIPCPATINIPRSNLVEEGAKCYDMIRKGVSREEAVRRAFTAKYNLDTDKYIRLGRIALYNKERYGYTDWWEWNIHFWGTKWNAYDSYIESKDTVCFDTAWNCPYPVIKRLSELFPDVELYLRFADEDIGYNCGSYTFYNGEETDRYEPEGDEAVEFACNITGYVREEDEE